jgi:hypothetical protein
MAGLQKHRCLPCSGGPRNRALLAGTAPLARHARRFIVGCCRSSQGGHQVPGGGTGWPRGHDSRAATTTKTQHRLEQLPAAMSCSCTYDLGGGLGFVNSRWGELRYLLTDSPRVQRYDTTSRTRPGGLGTNCQAKYRTLPVHAIPLSSGHIYRMRLQSECSSPSVTAM